MVVEFCRIAGAVAYGTMASETQGDFLPLPLPPPRPGLPTLRPPKFQMPFDGARVVLNHPTRDLSGNANVGAFPNRWCRPPRFELGISGGLDWEWEIVRRGRILGKLLLAVLGRCKKGVERAA